MSCIAALSFSESIDSVACRGRAQMRLECRAVNDVDRSVEQSGYIFLEAHIVVNRALGPRLKLNQNIEVAVGAICAARTEPNTAACATPRARKALSWRRRVARAS